MAPCDAAPNRHPRESAIYPDKSCLRFAYNRHTTRDLTSHFCSSHSCSLLLYTIVLVMIAATLPEPSSFSGTSSTALITYGDSFVTHQVMRP